MPHPCLKHVFVFQVEQKNFLLHLPLFLWFSYLLVGDGTEAPAVTMRNFKRQWRELSQEHKERISQSSKNKPKSWAHRQHISQGMTDYWRGVPHRPESGETLTMDEYLGKSNDTTYQEDATAKNKSR